jgi:hypothetical protein
VNTVIRRGVPSPAVTSNWSVGWATVEITCIAEW